jgi:hypothetical protein
MNQLFRMTYNRQGQFGLATLTLCKPGIVSATELAARLASSWHLTNWDLQRVAFRQHIRKYHDRVK